MCNQIDRSTDKRIYVNASELLRTCYDYLTQPIKKSILILIVAFDKRAEQNFTCICQHKSSDSRNCSTSDCFENVMTVAVVTLVALSCATASPRVMSEDVLGRRPRTRPNVSREPPRLSHFVPFITFSCSRVGEVDDDPVGGGRER
jgi:hypothetical protein